MFRFWPFSRETHFSPSDSIEDDTDWNVPEPETRRIIFGTRSTSVYGYPSSGGILVLPFCNGVDLEFLRLPRFNTAERSEDPAVEDQHCARMRMLGAWWFISMDEYITIQYCSPEKLDQKMLVVVAWPESGTGVWVVTMNRREAPEKGLACIWNAFSMDERCEIVEKLGGTFYRDPAECPHLSL
ncbi:hypothetical protein GGS26DRAFT_301472 [Hypomontagnella submonticulosa]|nr:hypothetical protein GGS26DRAFT_301472 [Hypomontagnella submonticulosa]